jgi:pimeloyl-ACP methyl ester carboxylesterase
VPSFLVKHPFRTDLELPKLAAAVIITHGTADRVIPYSHALALQKIRPDATLVTLDCDHLDFPGKSGEYERSLRAFLAANGIIDKAP